MFIFFKYILIILIKNLIKFNSKNFYFSIFFFFYNFLIKFRYNLFKIKIFYNYLKFLVFKLRINLKIFFYSKKEVISKKFLVKKIILFKKKISLFKKYNSLKYVYFYKFMRKKKNHFIYRRRFKKMTNEKIYDIRKKLFFYLRENRRIIRNLFLNKFSKQKKITRFLKKFNNKALLNKFYKFELSIFNILIQSSFFFYKNDVKYILKNKCVYVNRKIIQNPLFLLKKYDNIQLIVVKNYYIYNRMMRLYYKKILKKIRFSYFFQKKKKFSLYKQKKKTNPSWVLNLSFFKNSVPKYLEINFYFLSIYIVYYPTKLKQFNFIFWKFISFYKLKLYNWKSLT